MGTLQKFFGTLARTFTGKQQEAEAVKIKVAKQKKKSISAIHSGNTTYRKGHNPNVNAVGAKRMIKKYFRSQQLTGKLIMYDTDRGLRYFRVTEHLGHFQYRLKAA